MGNFDLRARCVLTRLQPRFLGFAFGVASGWLVLVPTYTSMRDSYPEWLPLMAWSLGPLLTALVFTIRHPYRAWELAACIEGGVIVGLILDIHVRGYLDIPSTVWPLAVAMVLVVSVPSLVIGLLLGRGYARISQQDTLHR